MQQEPNALHRFLELVDDAVHLEYEYVYYFPQVLERLATREKGAPHVEQVRAIIDRLYRDSLLHHAATMALMEKLGGRAITSWDLKPLPPLPENLDLGQWFAKQEERELLAAWIYDTAFPLAPEKALQEQLSQFAETERRHAAGIRQIQKLRGG